MDVRNWSPARVGDTAQRLTHDIGRRASEMVESGRDGWDTVARLPEDARANYQRHVEPRARRAGVGVLELGQALIAVAVAVPRLVSKSLTIARVLTERAEAASRRGHEVAEKTREFAHAVPPSAREIRSRRWRVVGWLSLGFAGGFAAGWIVGDARGLAAQARDDEQARRHASVVALKDAGKAAPAVAGVGIGVGVGEPGSADHPDGAGGAAVANDDATQPQHPAVRTSLRSTSADGG